MDEYLTSEAERRYRKKYYEKNRERLLKKAKEYREANKESIREYQKWSSKTHNRNEYHRQWQQKKRAEKREKELQEMFGGDQDGHTD